LERKKKKKKKKKGGGGGGGGKKGKKKKFFPPPGSRRSHNPVMGHEQETNMVAGFLAAPSYGAARQILGDYLDVTSKIEWATKAYVICNPTHPECQNYIAKRLEESLNPVLYTGKNGNSKRHENVLSRHSPTESRIQASVKEDICKTFEWISFHAPPPCPFPVAGTLVIENPD